MPSATLHKLLHESLKFAGVGADGGHGTFRPFLSSEVRSVFDSPGGAHLRDCRVRL